MEKQIREIVDKYLEGKYLVGGESKEAMISELENLLREEKPSPNPALKLAGKMAMHASDAIHANPLHLSDILRRLNESVKAYNTEIYSRVNNENK
jgi:hypothetical protein